VTGGGGRITGQCDDRGMTVTHAVITSGVLRIALAGSLVHAKVIEQRP
jgi:hypothetical protein